MTNVLVAICREPGVRPTWVSVYDGADIGDSDSVQDFSWVPEQQWREAVEWVDAMTGAILFAQQKGLLISELLAVDLPSHVYDKLKAGFWPESVAPYAEALRELVHDIRLISHVPSNREREIYSGFLNALPAKEVVGRYTGPAMVYYVASTLEIA